MTEPSRFQDNGDGSVFDSETGLTWTRKDSWQQEAKWFTWDEAMEYARHLSDIGFCGHSDWRMPNRVEALSLYTPDKTIKDKYGKEIHLDPAFPEGPLATLWLQEDFTGNEGYLLDLSNGEVRPLFKSKSGRMAVRPVRGGSSTI
ncbi:MAG: DUF1566 domain-containing protein [Nitrospinaceae bacterium]|nr:DUF1566 domain-containing protein [Nitrospinaceae bacterium]NIR53321.1 DUF1566 domain-containing protein [Nitrospinaceae bacterium]NIS83719.1 DUF1566 domain-containing protein [Nitrospinaceae bacterium]NIT80517.1 DUF1566 domain-containing protein [Nitrospinaceae bacterium]NIU42843.1 DUF1566 domain-containing protein [Nitrospinaceae bacterium]